MCVHLSRMTKSSMMDSPTVQGSRFWSITVIHDRYSKFRERKRSVRGWRKVAIFGLEVAVGGS